MTVLNYFGHHLATFQQFGVVFDPHSANMEETLLPYILHLKQLKKHDKNQMTYSVAFLTSD